MRAAQALGYEGWLALRQDVRSHYLASLTAAEVGAERADHVQEPTHGAVAALRQDVQNLSAVAQSLDRDGVERFAEAIACADRTLVVSAGSYDAVGLVLSHLAGVMGYPIAVEMRGGPHLANALHLLGPDSCLVAVAFWRVHAQTMTAARLAAAAGAAVCVITDSSTNALAAVADQLIVVPSESSSWFPSLVGGVSAVNAVLAVLAQRSDSRSADVLVQMELLWQEMDLYHRG